MIYLMDKVPSLDSYQAALAVESPSQLRQVAGIPRAPFRQPVTARLDSKGRLNERFQRGGLIARQKVTQVHAIVSKETEPELPGGGDPQPVAAVAEAWGIGRYEP